MMGGYSMRYVFVSVFFSSIASISLAVGARPYFPSAPTAEPERIIGDNNLEPIEKAIGTFYYTMAKSVARVELGGGYCTGFRIAEDLIMTNHHCLAACGILKFRFGYEQTTTRNQQSIFKCTRIEAKDEQLDFSIIRVAHESGPTPDLIPVVSLDRRPLEKDRLLFIAGHPQARTKEMDRSRNCKVEALPTSAEQNLTHTCDTEGGNSGSAVFDRETGYVVGLHWGFSGLNKATWMNKIIRYLESKHPVLVDELSVITN